MSPEWDVIVIGGGIVGLASGLALTERDPSLRVKILEKEPAVGRHQTGHNSGVLHSGVYYRPGSLKARLCVEGARRLIRFCEEQGVPYRQRGKVIVAADPQEMERLGELRRRGEANGVRGLRRLGPAELREVEPHVTGLAALHVPSAAVVDFGRVAGVMARCLEERGVAIAVGSEVVALEGREGDLRVVTRAGELTGRLLVNCAGLQSDLVAEMMGLRPEVRIVPFRGEYFLLRPDRAQLVRGLVYPVPDPAFPFLGVHLTRTITDQVEAGPNAVLALAREGYRHSTIRPGELWGTLAYPGFWRLAGRHWRSGISEVYRSFSKRAFVRALQRLVPELGGDDLVGRGAGVRAQAVDRDGRLVDDFSIVRTASSVHVLNAPSPAATASLAIGDHVADLALEVLGARA